MADEDYWQTSSVSKMKKVNIFDDTMHTADMKRFMQNCPAIEDDDDDSMDTINWDGTSVNKKPSSTVTLSGESSSSGAYQGSARYKPPSSLTAKSTTSSNGMHSGRSTVLSGKLPSRPDFEPSLSESIENTTPKKPLTMSEMSKMESEINSLKRTLEATRKDRFAKIHPKETVKRIIFGMPFSLEPYKGKMDKLTLLDEAIRLHDGNAITAVVLFLRDTVKPSIFNQELRTRPIAVNHYLIYLKLHHDTQEMLDCLSMLDRTEEAAIYRYKQAANTSHNATKLKSLQTCYRTHLQIDPMLSHEAAMVNEHVALLERQLPVEDADARSEREGDLRFKQNPRLHTLVNQPVLTTLYYCCLYHYNLADNNLASPLALKKVHSLTDKQYEWMAMMARAKLKQWPDLDQLFEAKGWFGNKKQKSVIGFDRIIPALHRLEAPKPVMNKFCGLIDDTNIRLEVAQKHQCYETAIETLKHLRDRERLMAYKGSLTANSQEWFYAQDVLKSTTIKWKN